MRLNDPSIRFLLRLSCWGFWVALSIGVLTPHLAFGSIGKTDSIAIVRAGSSEYEIVSYPGASEPIREAAKELQRVIEAATGVHLPIVPDKTPNYRQIVVGSHPLALEAGISADGLPLDGFRLRVLKKNLFLVGRDDSIQPFYLLNNDQSASAGTYFAVVEFVSRYLQARWYMPGPLGEEIPASSEVLVPATLDVLGQPRFAVRYIDVTLTRTREREEQLLKQGDISRVYFDEAAARLATRWGRHLRLGQNVQIELGQSWYLWMPAEKPTLYSTKVYGTSNPEYFAVPGGKNGKYYAGSDSALGGQLCIVNPDVAVELARNMVVFSQKTGKRAFSLGPNDGDWECSAACCGSKFRGSAGQADLRNQLVTFSNDVAERVSKEVVNARFGLLAYDWTLEPPTVAKTGPRIDVSDVYNGFPFRFHKPVERERVERLIGAWRGSAENVTLTTYYTYEGFYSLPWSTAAEQAWLVNELARYPSSRGVRMNYAPVDGPPMGALGPDPWILSQLLWDPEQSVDELRAEYFLGAFGPKAGPPLLEYFDAISSAMTAAIRDRPFTERSADHVVAYVDPAYGSVRARCRHLIDRAVEAVANDPERYRWRVDRIARAWRLAELTLDARAAGKAGRRAEASRLWTLRRILLADVGSQFAVAPTATDLMDRWVPLGEGPALRD